MDKWYVVQTKLNKEQTAKYNLIKQNFECYLPLISKTKTIGGKIVTHGLPLYPSYLFVKFDITQDQWRSIMGTRGVAYLLTATDSSVSSLPNGFVEQLISGEDKNGYVKVALAEKAVKKFSTGCGVRVKTGILEGHTGTCVNQRKDSVVVLMALLSGKVQVNLPRSSLEVV